MRTSALFGTRGPHFRDFVQTSFMDGPAPYSKNDVISSVRKHLYCSVRLVRGDTKSVVDHSFTRCSL